MKTIRQRTPRGFSDWFMIGPRNFDYCCDCGLAHENNYSVEINEKRKLVTIYMRSRRAKGKTRAHRIKRKLFARRS